MSTKLKLIIFFVVILFILIVLRMVAGPNQNQASADAITNIDQKALTVTFSDSLDFANIGSTSTYYLSVTNNSNQDLGSLRIYGYLGLPDSRSKISQSIFPNWLTPQSMQKYSDQNYFNYVVPMPAHSDASVRLPLKVKRLQSDQDTLCSQVFVQLIYPRKSWNLFQINPISNGPIIGSVEDLTKIN